MAQFSTGDPHHRWLSFRPALTTALCLCGIGVLEPKRDERPTYRLNRPSAPTPYWTLFERYGTWEPPSGATRVLLS